MKRVAVVTGAGGGIGRAITDRLSRNQWEVVGVDQRWPEGMPDGAIHLDLADGEATERALGGLPQVDALINNAAAHRPAPIAEMRRSDWDQVLAVNLTAAFIAIKATIPRLAEQQGAVVNMGSVHSLATSPAAAAYAAAKAGLVALTRSAAVELGPQGIRVNAVLPGAVRTPMLFAELEEREREEAIMRLAQRTPLQTIGDPEEIAEAVSFLLEQSQASFVTGQTLIVDGGATALLASEAFD